MKSIFRGGAKAVVALQVEEGCAHDTIGSIEGHLNKCIVKIED